MSSPERKILVRPAPAAGSRLAACRPDWSASRPAPCSRSIRTAPSPTAPVTGSIGTRAVDDRRSSRSTTRVGQEVRNQLLFLLYGGKAEPAAPRYTLSIVGDRRSAKRRRTSRSTRKTSRPRRSRLCGKLHAHRFKGTVVATGNRQFAASYDVPRRNLPPTGRSSTRRIAPPRARRTAAAGDRPGIWRKGPAS